MRACFQLLASPRVRELSRVTLQVFLDAHPPTGDNIRMITDEVSQIQEVSRTSSQRSEAAGVYSMLSRQEESDTQGCCACPQVRYCLKSLREQMAARQNNNKVNASMIPLSL